MMMNKEQLMRELEALEGHMFMLQMKDRWSREDYNTMDEWHREKRKLEQAIANM